jgi:DNA-binding transcriptional MocR family regulator
LSDRGSVVTAVRLGGEHHRGDRQVSAFRPYWTGPTGVHLNDFFSVPSPTPSASPRTPESGPPLEQPIRETGPHLAALLAAELSVAGDGPIYLRISDGLKRLVDRGDVALGTVLPAERSLARSLAVSRSTVVSAYDRLKTEGWLESRRGSGTWVRRPDATPARVDAVSTGRLFLAADGRIRDGDAIGPRIPAGTIDLSVAALPASPAVRAALVSLTQDGLDELLNHHGYLPHGLPTLRAAVVERLATRGMTTDAERVVITTGAHQAISLIARQTIQAGDSVIVESPTFPGALDVFRRFGARAIPLPLDELGARTGLLEDLVLRTGARLVYVSPDFHNPTGSVMPLERREEIARTAERTGIIVIEDQTMSELDLEDHGLPPSIASIAPEAAIMTIGSTAKLFWAGLRTGWVHVPADWVVRMLATKTVADLGTPLLDQQLSVQLLAQVDQVRAERARELRPRRDALIAALGSRLPEWSFSVPAGGLSLWVHLPSGNAEEFAELALQRGVAVVPGPSLSVDDGNRRALRMAYVEPEDRLVEAVERLADTWERYEPAPPRPSARLLI